MNEVEVGVFIAFTAGVFSFLSPCVLPLVPSYLTFVTGMSLEDLQEGVDRKTTFTHSLLFVVGFSSIFILLGASASFLGQFLRAYEIWIARIGGVIIVLLGMHLAGVFKITPLLREKRLHLNDKPAGYLGTLGVGVAFGAGWTPCIGPAPPAATSVKRRGEKPRSIEMCSTALNRCCSTSSIIPAAASSTLIPSF